jgi:hypothetical protein
MTPANKRLVTTAEVQPAERVQLQRRHSDSQLRIPKHTRNNGERVRKRPLSHSNFIMTDRDPTAGVF